MEEITIDSRDVVSGFNLIHGDILITNGTSFAGIIGHAAIVDDARTVLDIPRPGKTTRVLSHADWIKEYADKGWVKVYRIKNREDIGRAAARWADKNYYSTTGSTTQNIYPKYEITPHLYSTDPTYCSKIVYQAYWYESGVLSVMEENHGFVSPYGLIDCFTKAYKPVQVKFYP